jgi:hypothetical protein|tara:strand:+ start:1044 stop:2585 length:1542 start_codon:yes stop_codon:yes gene_type:complete
MTEDLGKKHQDWAVYLPAISGFYVTQLQKMDANPSEWRCPEGFEKGTQGMNFLDPENSYYHYPWGLYSGGHAHLDPVKSDEREPMVQGRDRSKTMILGDSGGFQLATGVIKMDWSNAKDPNDPARTEFCNKILTWLEHTADWSMTLDVPAFAAVGKLSERTGLTEFQDTLDISLLNLDYFMRNRTPGATKFLNVLSGSNEENSKQWYDAVKHFSNKSFVQEAYGDENKTLEGYAFAGINMKHMYSVLSRLLDLREDGLLEGKDWIHFLGTGRLNWACHLTSIQRQLRKHDNPNITLSFDAASPFVNTAYGQTYTHNEFRAKRFGYFMDRAFDNKDMKGSKMPMPFAHSPIMSRLTVGDICVLGHGDLNRNGKECTTSWDTLSYALYMGHSVYNHITATQEANRLADMEKHRTPSHWKNWKKVKGSSVSNETSPYVPGTILMFDSFAEEVLDPNNTNARQMLEDNKEFLKEISFSDGSAEQSTFGALFETDEYESGDSEADMQEDIMRADFDGE